jgi:drug/metabolite transporter, DME family
MTQNHRTGVLFILGAALLWSTGGIGIKAIADAPLKVTFYRSLFAAIALFVMFHAKALPRRGGWRVTPGFLVAIVCYASCLTTFVIATKWTTAANAIFLEYAGVVWVLILAPFILKERFQPRDAIAVAVALAGMALFFVGDFEARGMAGNALALASSVFFAGLVLALRRERAASEAVIIWGNVLAAVAMLPFVAGDLSLTPRSFVVLALLGIVQIGAAYALFVHGLKQVSATQASLTGMLEPVANPIWVFLFLHEKPQVYAIAGAVIVLAAIGWRTAVGGGEVAEMPAVD